MSKFEAHPTPPLDCRNAPCSFESDKFISRIKSHIVQNLLDTYSPKKYCACALNCLSTLEFKNPYIIYPLFNIAVSWPLKEIIPFFYMRFENVECHANTSL